MIERYTRVFFDILRSDIAATFICAIFLLLLVFIFVGIISDIKKRPKKKFLKEMEVFGNKNIKIL